MTDESLFFVGVDVGDMPEWRQVSAAAAQRLRDQGHAVNTIDMASSLTTAAELSEAMKQAVVRHLVRVSTMHNGKPSRVAFDDVYLAHKAIIDDPEIAPRFYPALEAERKRLWPDTEAEYRVPARPDDGEPYLYVDPVLGHAEVRYRK